MIEIIRSLFRNYGIFGVFLGMCLESMGIPGAGAALDILAGPLHHEEGYHALLITLVANSGLTVGSIISYLIGRRFSDWLYRFLEKHGRLAEFEKAKNFAEKHEKAGIFLAQLYGTTRTFISFPAGMMGLSFFRFAVFTFLGGLVYCLAITLASIYAYGYLKLLYLKYSEYFMLNSALALFVAIFAGWFLVKKINLTIRNRDR